MARNYAAEYQRRIERNLAKGLSRDAARGHAKADEPTAKDIADARKNPDGVPIAVLRRAVRANARALFADHPKFSDNRTWMNIKGLKGSEGRKTLKFMLFATADQWAASASAQYDRNPFFYH